MPPDKTHPAVITESKQRMDDEGERKTKFSAIRGKQSWQKKTRFLKKSFLKIFFKFLSF